MKNPYDVLGIPSSSTIEQVKEAYRRLSGKYQSSEYSSGPLAEQASRKMDEINEAYDSIIYSRSDSQTSSGTNNSYSSYTQANNGFTSDLSDIRVKIQEGRIDDAEIRLDGISPTQRTAEWYYLKGSVNNCRGWFEEAKKNFTIACQMDPSNQEYRAAFNSLSGSNSTAGGYRTRQRNSKHDGDFGTVCKICETLWCADCCCECFGGDLIPCC